MTETELEQKFLPAKGLRPLMKIDEKMGTIFIAESDLETDRPLDYPWGYYQTAWFIATKASKGKIDGGSWMEFESMHDTNLNLTKDQKQQARVNTALSQAKEFIDKNLKTGRING